MTNGSRTVSEIIDSLGGTAAVARMTSLTAQAVSNWRARNSIPAKYWSVLVCGGAGRVSLDALALAASTPQQQQAA